MQDERRSNFRVEWNGTAKIAVQGRVVGSCIVSNLSNGGAKLRTVVANAKLPDQFYVHIFDQERPRLCSVTWRRGDEVGVQFADATTEPAKRTTTKATKLTPA